MFSPDQFVHLVIADENDVYYGEDLLKMDLNQYLWWKLHREDYRAVYFLQEERGQFTLQTYGDTACRSYIPDHKLALMFKPKTDQFGNWMVQQLKEKREQRAAFVCPLDVFCRTAGTGNWEGVLKKMANMERRTGILILTAPVEDERTRELLLNSDVFAALGENGIYGLRAGTLRPMYESLTIAKSVTFLGSYTKKRIRPMLLHVVMDSEEMDIEELWLDRCAEYLAQYLNNPEMRRRMPLLGVRTGNELPRYQELYRRLSNRESFKALMAGAQRAFAEGDLRSYLAEQGCNYVAEGDRQTFVSRDRNSFAGKCLKQWPPKDFESPEIYALLEDIRSALLSPKNRKDNPKIAASVDELLTKLGEAQSLRDAATYKRVLSAIRFCVQWIHVPENSVQEESACSLCEGMKQVIECSCKCFQLEQQLGHLSMGNSLLAAQHRQALAYSFAAEKKKLEKVERLVEENVAQLVVTDAANGLKEVAQRLQEQMEQCEEPKAEIELPPEPEPTPKIVASDEDEEDLLVIEALYSDIPQR